MEQLEKEQAKKNIIAAIEEYDNIIVFGFKKNGEAVTITATDDPLYDNGNMFLYRYTKYGTPNDIGTPHFENIIGAKWCYCNDLIH